MASGPAAYDFSPPAGPEATVRQWDRSDAAIGLALVVLLISLFLPWFSVTTHIRAAGISNSANGPRVHSYLWAVFVLALIGLLVLVARDAIARIPGNLPSAGQLLVGTSGLALALAVLAVATKPAGFSERVPNVIQPLLGHITVSISWSYGGFVAVLAAAVALVTAFTSAGPLQEASRVTRPAPAAGP
jgi:hypothetical protein